MSTTIKCWFYVTRFIDFPVVKQISEGCNSNWRSTRTKLEVWIIWTGTRTYNFNNWYPETPIPQKKQRKHELKNKQAKRELFDNKRKKNENIGKEDAECNFCTERLKMSKWRMYSQDYKFYCYETERIHSNVMLFLLNKQRP